MLGTQLLSLASGFMFFSLAVADPIDWINIEYLVRQSATPSGSRGSTRDSQRAVVQSAESNAKKGPWTIVTGDVLPPSRNQRDYMSFAPYHWPDCNWCRGGGRTHISKGNNSASDPNDDPDDETSPPSGPDYNYDPYVEQDSSVGQQSYSEPGTYATHRMTKRRMHVGNARARELRDDALPDQAPFVTPLLPTTVSALPTFASQTGRPPSGTPNPVMAPAKTHSTEPSCTPSPTRSLAPSATWTTCPYIVRDGKVNPDVRTLPAPRVLGAVAQNILSNGLAYAINQSPSHLRNVTDAIQTFFVKTETAMSPNANYAQIVRGPGPKGQSGTFTGVLDMHVLVKVSNTCALFKRLEPPGWNQWDQALRSWMGAYINWLNTAPIAISAKGKPNNHGTFFAAQFAALSICRGDREGAKSALDYYFRKIYPDQIASSGEQPFEAKRTRPYHYRCYNLEAMITIAKLGDQLGENYWGIKTEHGATIQTAVDYVMGLDPKGEDRGEVIPHVAATAAAYGDPSGKYGQFLGRYSPNYKSMPFWFYDQPGAMPNSPNGRRVAGRHMNTLSVGAGPEGITATNDTKPTDSFYCPQAFQGNERVEIDNDVYVTCDELKPLYDAVGYVGGRT